MSKVREVRLFYPGCGNNFLNPIKTIINDSDGYDSIEIEARFCDIHFLRNSHDLRLTRKPVGRELLSENRRFCSSPHHRDFCSPPLRKVMFAFENIMAEEEVDILEVSQGEKVVKIPHYANKELRSVMSYGVRPRNSVSSRLTRRRERMNRVSQTTDGQNRVAPERTREELLRGMKQFHSKPKLGRDGVNGFKIRYKFSSLLYELPKYSTSVRLELAHTTWQLFIRHLVNINWILGDNPDSYLALIGAGGEGGSEFLSIPRVVVDEFIQPGARAIRSMLVDEKRGESVNSRPYSDKLLCIPIWGEKKSWH